jgi:UDP-glucose 4-epimerase
MIVASSASNGIVKFLHSGTCSVYGVPQNKILREWQISWLTHRGALGNG